MLGRFLIRFTIFCTPFVVLFASLFGILTQAGEFNSPESIVEMQLSDENIIYGPIVTRETVLRYKLLGVEMRRPEVVITGSSRVLQFRAEFLGDNSDLFYNAGGSGWHIRETRTFVEQLTEENAPDILIIGFDQNHFERRFPTPDEPVEINRSIYNENHVLSSFRSFVETMMDGTRRQSFENIMEQREPVYGQTGLGIGAVRYGFGYRNDGSRQRGREISEEGRAENNRNRILREWQNDERVYEWSDESAEYTLDNIRRLLVRAEELDIYVIGFTPPYMTSLYQWIENSGQHDYILEASSHIQGVFDEFDRPFHDFTNPTLLNGTDDDFFDHWHTTELHSLRMFATIVETSPEFFEPYVSTDYLYNVIENATVSLVVFGPSSQ